MDNKLAPCPFCDHKVLMPHVHSRSAKTAGGYHYFVRCPRCHTEGPRSLSSKDDAIEAWNRRAPAPQAAPLVLTYDQVREAGGIVHKDGNIFFTNLDKLNNALQLAQPEVVTDGPAGWRGAFQNLVTATSPAPAVVQMTDDPVRKVLQEICDMQARGFGNGVATHLRLIDLTDKARAILSAAEVKHG